MEKNGIKWAELDEIRQHAFKADGDYNISLCGKIIHMTDQEMFASIDYIEDEGYKVGACKICTKKFLSIN